MVSLFLILFVFCGTSFSGLSILTIFAKHRDRLQAAGSVCWSYVKHRQETATDLHKSVGSQFVSREKATPKSEDNGLHVSSHPEVKFAAGGDSIHGFYAKMLPLGAKPCQELERCGRGLR